MFEHVPVINELFTLELISENSTTHKRVYKFKYYIINIDHFYVINIDNRNESQGLGFLTLNRSKNLIKKKRLEGKNNQNTPNIAELVNNLNYPKITKYSKSFFMCIIYRSKSLPLVIYNSGFLHIYHILV